ncbi:unnamed protein product, partial [Amoebophrya sp. A120]|eukprot:GSA120T00008451001.1
MLRSMVPDAAPTSDVVEMLRSLVRGNDFVHGYDDREEDEGDRVFVDDNSKKNTASSHQQRPLKSSCGPRSCTEMKGLLKNKSSGMRTPPGEVDYNKKQQDS